MRTVVPFPILSPLPVLLRVMKCSSLSPNPLLPLSETCYKSPYTSFHLMCVLVKRKKKKKSTYTTCYLYCRLYAIDPLSHFKIWRVWVFCVCLCVSVWISLPLYLFPSLSISNIFIFIRFIFFSRSSGSLFYFRSMNIRSSCSGCLFLKPIPTLPHLIPFPLAQMIRTTSGQGTWQVFRYISWDHL